jgi:hypothetical protein
MTKLSGVDSPLFLATLNYTFHVTHICVESLLKHAREFVICSGEF